MTDTDLLVSIPDGFDPEGLRVYRLGELPTTPTLWWLGWPGETFQANDRLSLADARTRDALARWVAGFVGLPRELQPTAPMWWFEYPGWSLQVRNAISFHFADDIRPLSGDRVLQVPALVLLLENGWPLGSRSEVPAPMLPDGTRRTDAAALAAVVRHLTSVPA